MNPQLKPVPVLINTSQLQPFPMVLIRLAGKYMEVLIDTGATRSLINEAWLGGKWPTVWEPKGIVELLCGVDGRAVETVGAVTLKLLIGVMGHMHKFVVVRGMAPSVIVGVDILSVLHFVVDLDHDFLRTPRGTVRFLPEKILRTNTAVLVPARSSPDGGFNNLLQSVDFPECIKNTLAILVKE
ncbi:hypothetical protein D915_000005 [Fasciola hepatica]|uniref:Peptidase A2 domain-containing protein n=1 Tax=Fasciola hepatica TaxID=6192 RepID=A0A4E0S4D2_FASHE|nr:hypothetical protein D915_000005 [Fasciola hepatica]